MSQPIPNAELTERFLYETVPELFAITSSTDIEAGVVEYMGYVTEVAGVMGSNNSQFDWQGLPSILHAINPVTTVEAMKRREQKIADISFTAPYGEWKIGEDEQGSYGSIIRPDLDGTHVVVDAKGLLQGGSSFPNPKVDPSYGDPTYYVLEKLGWAKYAEVVTHQGADWGEGYAVVTDFLRRIGRIGATALPHVGMATAHEIPYSEVTKGTDRNALAYASASNFTLSHTSVQQLLANPRFLELYKRDQELGRFTNIADWLAGRLDSLVARRANEIFLKRAITMEFPYLDTPDYTDVDNN